MIRLKGVAQRARTGLRNGSRPASSGRVDEIEHRKSHRPQATSRILANPTSSDLDLLSPLRDNPGLQGLLTLFFYTIMPTLFEGLAARRAWDAPKRDGYCWATTRSAAA
jgi:hypothetical protein